MPQPQPIPNAPRVLRLIHAALAAGQGMLAIVLTVRLNELHAPLAPGSEALATPFAIGSVVLAAIAATFLRRLVPERPDSVSPDDFWKEPRTAQAAIVLWAVFEAGGLLGIVGYGITGSIIPGIAGGIALGLLLVHRPGFLEG